MALTLVDTPLLIDYLAGQEPVTSTIVRELESGNLATTALARAELLAAARTPRMQNQVKQLLNSLTTLSLDGEAAAKAADICHATALPFRDALTAGVAMSAAARLMVDTPGAFLSVAHLVLVSSDGAVPIRGERLPATS